MNPADEAEHRIDPPWAYNFHVISTVIVNTPRGQTLARTSHPDLACAFVRATMSL